MANNVWTEIEVKILVVLVVLLCGIGTAVITAAQGCYYRSQAIESGAARFNPKTGEFEWKSVENMGNVQ